MARKALNVARAAERARELQDGDPTGRALEGKPHVVAGDPIGRALEGKWSVSVTVHLKAGQMKLVKRVALHRKVRQQGLGRAGVSGVVRDLIDANADALAAELDE